MERVLVREINSTIHRELSCSVVILRRFGSFSFVSLEPPVYELEGEGYASKIVVNSIARFRLRTISFANVHARHRSDPMDLFSVSILDPFGHHIVVQRRLLSSDLLELTYQPMSVGQHQLSISFNERIDRQLTLDVIQEESNSLSKLKPFGPGLQRAIVGLPTEFYVHLHAPTVKMHLHDHLQFCLEPSYQAEIDYEQQLATVRYTPKHAGDCPIHILEYNKDIRQSPFLAHFRKVSFTKGPPRVQVTGLSAKIIVHRSVEFQVSRCSSLRHYACTDHFEGRHR